MLRLSLTVFSFFLALFITPLASAQDDSLGGGSLGLRLGVGANFHNFEQEISGTAVNVDTTATEYSFVHLSFSTLFNSRVMGSLYGQISSVTMASDPTVLIAEDRVTLYDVSLEGRALVEGEWTERVSWRPVVLFGLNAMAIPVIVPPNSLTGLYEYDRMDLFSVFAGLGSTAYFGDNILRASIRAGAPFATSSNFDFVSAYYGLAQVSYTLDLGRAGSLGLDGLVRYMTVDFDQFNILTTTNVSNDVKIFTTGARIFYNFAF